MNSYIFVTTLFFLFLAIIWNKNTTVNLLIKLTLWVFVFWALALNWSFYVQLLTT